MSGGLYSTEGRDFDQTLDLKKIKPYRGYDERRKDTAEFHFTCTCRR